MLRNELGVMTPKFGCGMAQCGACSVLLDGAEIRSCITPIAALAGKEVTTVEGLPARWAKQRKLPDKGAQGALHPVQEAWIEEQVPQCGICQFGMMIKVTELLEANPTPTDDRDQGRAHHLGAVAALVPVRQLCRDHGWCAPCRTPHGRRWEMTTPDTLFPSTAQHSVDARSWPPAARWSSP